ncbi:MAG: hypothetical protein ACHQ7M_09225 [Chloroflexota bacterium]|jgi:hypothetical protein
MAAVDDNKANALREDLAELQMALTRKHNEVSNLKVGYIRAVEGAGPIPSEPLRRNLIAARAELTDIEERVAVIRQQLGEPEQPRTVT